MSNVSIDSERKLYKVSITVGEVAQTLHLIVWSIEDVFKFIAKDKACDAATKIVIEELSSDLGIFVIAQ